MISRMSEPEKRNTIWSPTSVATEIMALRMMWRVKTARAASPFAVAVRT